jgi:hypothetical protein
MGGIDGHYPREGLAGPVLPIFPSYARLARQLDVRSAGTPPPRHHLLTPMVSRSRPAATSSQWGRPPGAFLRALDDDDSTAPPTLAMSKRVERRLRPRRLSSGRERPRSVTGPACRCTDRSLAGSAAHDGAGARFGAYAVLWHNGRLSVRDPLNAPRTVNHVSKTDPGSRRRSPNCSGGKQGVIHASNQATPMGKIATPVPASPLPKRAPAATAARSRSSALPPEEEPIP